MLVSPDSDWLKKTLRTCEMWLVWNKQTIRLIIYFTCKLELMTSIDRLASQSHLMFWMKYYIPHTIFSFWTTKIFKIFILECDYNFYSFEISIKIYFLLTTNLLRLNFSIAFRSHYHTVTIKIARPIMFLPVKIPCFMHWKRKLSIIKWANLPTDHKSMLSSLFIIVN